MIFSKLNGGDDLSAYPAAIQRALAYLRDTDIMSLELGRHELEGDDMFVNVMDMTTHPMEGSHPEVHKKYIDLMYWPEGGERIGVAPYLGTEPVGYFALDLGPAGAMCLSRLFIKEKARGQGIGRSIVAYAQKLAEGDGRSRLYLRIWARDLKAEGFAKKCRFRKAETVPMEVLPGTTLDITTWEKLWR